VKRAVDAGAKRLRPVADQFYGDRMGTLEDPFGHVWSIATHVEDVSAEEMRRRSEGLRRSQAGDPVPRCSSEPISARSASVRPFAKRWRRGITSVVSKYACAQPGWMKPEGMKRPSS